MIMEAQYQELREQLRLVIDRLDALVRLEERHKNTVESLNRAHDRVDKLEAKVDVLEQVVTSNSFVTKIAERLGWMLISAGVAISAYVIK
jgi:predicted nuclease with TOPRIM domain